MLKYLVDNVLNKGFTVLMKGVFYSKYHCEF